MVGEKTAVLSYIKTRLLTQNIYEGIVEASLADDSNRYQTKQRDFRSSGVVFSMMMDVHYSRHDYVDISRNPREKWCDGHEAGSNEYIVGPRARIVSAMTTVKNLPNPRTKRGQPQSVLRRWCHP